MAETASRMALENALFLYAPLERQRVAKVFLEALSVDELHFLAEFLGSCILVSSTAGVGMWDAVRHRAHAYRRGMGETSLRKREDLGHKLILVIEFAGCCGFPVNHR